MGPAELDRRVLLSYEEEPATFVRGGCCSRRMCACLGRRSQGLQVAAVLVTVQLIFGGYAVVVKVAMRDHVDALIFSLYRDIGASVVLLGACTIMGERKPVHPGDRLLFVGELHCTHTARVRARNPLSSVQASGCAASRSHRRRSCWRFSTCPRSTPA